jgi:putative FmdB family regulatory protein
MPIYEFKCHDCGAPFETLVMGFSTDGIECPACKSENIKKEMSSFAVSGGSITSSSFNASSAACNTGST